jgi:hypothetical protein
VPLADASDHPVTGVPLNVVTPATPPHSSVCEKSEAACSRLDAPPWPITRDARLSPKVAVWPEVNCTVQAAELPKVLYTLFAWTAPGGASTDLKRSFAVIWKISYSKLPKVRAEFMGDV